MRHVADVAAGIANLGVAQNRNASARRSRQACDRAQQGRFAGAVVPENDVQRSGSKFCRDAAQRGERPELLDEAGYSYHRLRDGAFAVVSSSGQ